MKAYFIYDLHPIQNEIEYVLMNEYLDDNRLSNIDTSKLVEHVVLCTMADIYGLDFNGRRSFEIARVREVMSRMPSRVVSLIRNLPVPLEISGEVVEHWRRGDDLYLTIDHITI